MQHKKAENFVLLENFIDQYRESNGVSPTTQTIADGTGLSTATVSRYMQQMRKDGILEYDGHRNIRTKKSMMETFVSTDVPILGAVSCGVPKFADENIESYVRLPVALFGEGNFYLLRANGDSMIEANIDDGDLVLIRQQDYADPGQIVVALIEDEATLKRYYPEAEKRRVRLHPENEALEDIYTDSCIIQGVATKVFKDLM